MALSIAEAWRPSRFFNTQARLPVAIGTFTTNVDMKSGAPAFGTPEYMRATQMTGNSCGSTSCPFGRRGCARRERARRAAMWETSNSLWAAVQSRTNMVYHAAGWLEGGLIASPEKFTSWIAKCSR